MKTAAEIRSYVQERCAGLPMTSATTIQTQLQIELLTEIACALIDIRQLLAAGRKSE